MDSLDLQVLTQTKQWVLNHHRVTLITVLETWGSAPRPPGALLALCDTGLVVGSVSGGCVEDDLIRRVKQGERISQPTLVTYGVTKEEAARFGLPCGGSLRLVLEPVDSIDWIDEVLSRTARHELVARTLNLETGQSTLQTVTRAEQFDFTYPNLKVLFGPRWRLLLIGAGQLSRAIAQMAHMLDFEVICSDPRKEYALTWDIPNTTFSTMMPDDLVLDLQLDAHSAVVAVTHDPKLDDMALLEALKSPAFYVGALGSRTTTQARKQRLALFDLSDAEINRLYGPTGLDLGSKGPAEMALEIMAEIIAIKNKVAISQKKPGSAMPELIFSCQAE